MYKVCVELLNQQFKNLHEFRIGQRGEDDDLVQAVDELGVEGSLHLAHHHLLHLREDDLVLGRLEAEAFTLHQVLGPDVRSHHEDRVLEVDRVAETVGELAVFKDLEQQVEDIRVRLFDLVEQHNGVRIAFYPFRELTALLVPT